MLFQQQGGLKQATGETRPGLWPEVLPVAGDGDAVGDALNAIGYRMRPYEKEKAPPIARSAIAPAALQDLPTHQHRAGADQVPPHPAAVESIARRSNRRSRSSGEFWAMTTEGDGNYGLQASLRKAPKVDIQIVTNWLL